MLSFKKKKNGLGRFTNRLFKGVFVLKNFKITIFKGGLIFKKTRKKWAICIGKVRAGHRQACISSDGIVQCAHGHACRMEHTGPYILLHLILFFL
jgi:hypothetical protein